MFERFSERAIKTIMLAQEESRRLGHNFVGTEQILIGLLGQEETIAGRALNSKGVTRKEARVEVEKIISRGSGFVAVEIPFTPRAKRVLELAWNESKDPDCGYIGTEHLLLGLIGEGDGVACRVLQNFGVNLLELREAVIDLKTIYEGTESSPEKVERSQSQSQASNVFQCPNCAEKIKMSAILCRFCNTGLSVEHFEECPFCKEMIRKSAKLCRYCRSDLPAPSTD